MSNFKTKPEAYITRNIKIDAEFLGEITSENVKMNAVRAKRLEKKISSSEELVELAKEGMAHRKRLREIS